MSKRNNNKIINEESQESQDSNQYSGDKSDEDEQQIDQYQNQNQQNFFNQNQQRQLQHKIDQDPKFNEIDEDDLDFQKEQIEKQLRELQLGSKDNKLFQENFNLSLSQSDQDEVQSNDENEPQKMNYLKPKMNYTRPQTGKPKKPFQEKVNLQNDDVEIGSDLPKSQCMFKPVYKLSMNEFKQSAKQYDYQNKKFTTVIKKNDPVSRYQSMSKTWKKTKFLNNNSTVSKGSTQGRKLQLCERIANSRPEYIFHKYLNKDQTKIMY